jgi:hypothetical protein
VAGFQAAVAWQDSQLADELMCPAGLPVALVPLWQAAQPLTMPAWVNVEGFQALVPWHEVQSADVATCAAPLPVARVPS